MFVCALTLALAAAGTNEIVVRSEMVEPTFGWGFWMRVDEVPSARTP